jgi:cytochrome oxidase assembly protein ShyY1
MKTTTTSKKLVSGKILSAAVVITMMASVILAVWQIPTATATSLEEIRISREISAPIDQVWNIVADVDNETKYWPTFKEIKNINKTNNTTIYF